MQNATKEVKPQNEQWQRMDSAPKDGTSIIVYTHFDGYIPWVSWVGHSWVSESCAWDGNPIAWMPFPDAPRWSDEEGT